MLTALGFHKAMLTAGAGATILASASLTATVFGWASFGASMAAILTAAVSLLALARRNRRMRNSAPIPPRLGASKAEWELYAHLLEQHLKDKEAADDGQLK